MKVMIGEGMQFTIDLEKLIGKFRYILLGFLIVLTFFLRDTTSNEASDEVTNDVPIVEEATTKDNDVDSAQDPAPSKLVVEEGKLEKAVVLQIIDGETVELQFSKQRYETVKLLYVDAPNDGERFSEQVIQRLRELMIKESVVEVEPGELSRNEDGQLLAYIWKDGESVNLQLVQEGLAKIAPVEHPNTKYIETFYEGQSLAQSQKLYIWQ